MTCILKQAPVINGKCNEFTTCRGDVTGVSPRLGRPHHHIHSQMR